MGRIEIAHIANHSVRGKDALQRFKAGLIDIGLELIGSVRDIERLEQPVQIRDDGDGQEPPQRGLDAECKDDASSRRLSLPTLKHAGLSSALEAWRRPPSAVRPAETASRSSP
jgi:hypothetical protein